MKKFLLVICGFFVATQLHASTSTLDCKNSEDLSVSLKINETQFIPYVSLETSDYNISGFVKVLEDSESRKQWTLRFDTSKFISIKFKEKIQLYWSIEDDPIFICENQ
jgi:hypothetical protein